MEPWMKAKVERLRDDLLAKLSDNMQQCDPVSREHSYAASALIICRESFTKLFADIPVHRKVDPFHAPEEQFQIMYQMNVALRKQVKDQNKLAYEVYRVIVGGGGSSGGDKSSGGGGKINSGGDGDDLFGIAPSGPSASTLNNIHQLLSAETRRIRDEVFHLQHHSQTHQQQREQLLQQSATPTKGEEDSSSPSSATTTKTTAAEAVFQPRDLSLQDLLRLAEYKLQYAAQSIQDHEFGEGTTDLNMELKLQEMTREHEMKLSRLQKQLDAERMSTATVAKNSRIEFEKYQIESEQTYAQTVQRYESELSTLKVGFEDEMRVMTQELEMKITALQEQFAHDVSTQQNMRMEDRRQALSDLRSTLADERAKMEAIDKQSSSAHGAGTAAAAAAAGGGGGGGSRRSMEASGFMGVSHRRSGAEDLRDEAHEVWGGENKETLIQLLQGKKAEIEMIHNFHALQIRARILEWETELRQVIARYEQELTQLKESADVERERAASQAKLVDTKAKQINSLKGQIETLHYSHSEAINQLKKDHDEDVVQMRRKKQELLQQVEEIKKEFSEATTGFSQKEEDFKLREVDLNKVVRELRASLDACANQQTSAVAVQTDPIPQPPPQIVYKTAGKQPTSATGGGGGKAIAPSSSKDQRHRHHKHRREKGVGLVVSPSTSSAQGNLSATASSTMSEKEKRPTPQQREQRRSGRYSYYRGARNHRHRDDHGDEERVVGGRSASASSLSSSLSSFSSSFSSTSSYCSSSLSEGSGRSSEAAAAAPAPQRGDTTFMTQEQQQQQEEEGVAERKVAKPMKKRDVGGGGAAVETQLQNDVLGTPISSSISKTEETEKQRKHRHRHRHHRRHRHHHDDRDEKQEEGDKREKRTSIPQKSDQLAAATSSQQQMQQHTQQPQEPPSTQAEEQGQRTLQLQGQSTAGATGGHHHHHRNKHAPPRQQQRGGITQDYVPSKTPPTASIDRHTPSSSANTPQLEVVSVSAMRTSSAGSSSSRQGQQQPEQAAAAGGDKTRKPAGGGGIRLRVEQLAAVAGSGSAATTPVPGREAVDGITGQNVVSAATTQIQELQVRGSPATAAGVAAPQDGASKATKPSTSEGGKDSDRASKPSSKAAKARKEEGTRTESGREDKQTRAGQDGAMGEAHDNEEDRSDGTPGTFATRTPADTPTLTSSSSSEERELGANITGPIDENEYTFAAELITKFTSRQKINELEFYQILAEMAVLCEFSLSIPGQRSQHSILKRFKMFAPKLIATSCDNMHVKPVAAGSVGQVIDYLEEYTLKALFDKIETFEVPLPTVRDINSVSNKLRQTAQQCGIPRSMLTASDLTENISPGLAASSSRREDANSALDILGEDAHVPVHGVKDCLAAVLDLLEVRHRMKEVLPTLRRRDAPPKDATPRGQPMMIVSSTKVHSATPPPAITHRYGGGAGGGTSSSSSSVTRQSRLPPQLQHLVSAQRIGAVSAAHHAAASHASQQRWRATTESPPLWSVEGGGEGK